MTLYVYIAQSLDGFIADKNSGLDWLNEIPNPDNSDFGFNEFISKIDAIVMGRNTFETVQSFGMWPYTKPVYVISSTLSELPKVYHGKADILNLKPVQLIEKLNDKGFNNLYIDGGALIITTVPVLLGDGISLFGKLKNSLQLQFQKSETLADSLVKSHYIRERNYK